MSRGLNKFQGIGNLGANPELRSTQGNTAVCNFRVACTTNWSSNGERKENTEWVQCVSFGRLAEIVGDNLTKGSKVYFDGRLQTRKWQDKQGQDRYSTEVVVDELIMLDGKRDHPHQDAHNEAKSNGYAPPPSDDIPF